MSRIFAPPTPPPYPQGAAACGGDATLISRHFLPNRPPFVLPRLAPTLVKATSAFRTRRRVVSSHGPATPKAYYAQLHGALAMKRHAGVHTRATGAAVKRVRGDAGPMPARAPSVKEDDDDDDFSQDELDGDESDAIDGGSDAVRRVALARMGERVCMRLTIEGGRARVCGDVHPRSRTILTRPCWTTTMRTTATTLSKASLSGRSRQIDGQPRGPRPTATLTSMRWVRARTRTLSRRSATATMTATVTATRLKGEGRARGPRLQRTLAQPRRQRQQWQRSAMAL